MHIHLGKPLSDPPPTRRTAPHYEKFQQWEVSAFSLSALARDLHRQQTPLRRQAISNEQCPQEDDDFHILCPCGWLLPAL